MNPKNLRRCLGAYTALCACASLLAGHAVAAEPNFPITAEQRSTAQQVAQAGVPLSELAPNAPDSHTVQSGDTLWDISKLFLKSPWRWPELWGMNLEQVRNPHLIYPGQVLVLEKSDGRARLRVAQSGSGAPSNTVKLSPRVRSNLLDNGAIGSIPLNLIGPFLTEAVIFNNDELNLAPRIVAAQEGFVAMSQGQLAYVVGDLGKGSAYRLFREPQPLYDFDSKELLGYEARYVGTAEFVRPGRNLVESNGKPVVVPATVSIQSVRMEVNVGDRLAPLPARDLEAYAPHNPNVPMAGRVLSIYGEGLSAGQNQIVALNRGARDGVERGHVLALWRQGDRRATDINGQNTVLQLPNESNGLLFVFSVFERASYALILSVNVPVFPGDAFTQP
ncbi:MAG TPA: LysM peptidoglycan-binding domain-containing protein [Rubrivivax sp.]|nr:LysM peptidoglycan-binding domain-containing protein [Rubrivivax sp.]